MRTQVQVPVVVYKILKLFHLLKRKFTNFHLLNSLKRIRNLANKVKGVRKVH